MALIDPDGLFNGDRFTLMSDSARFAWPYFWCASNTVGRIELNYHKVVARAFSRFKKPPSEEQFWVWVGEFRAAYLLFVYEVNGQVWGQWDTSEKFLPRWKLAADAATPAANARQFLLWRNSYFQTKQAEADAKARKISEFVSSPKSSEAVCGDLYGVGDGVGVGGGEDKPSCAADGAAPEAELLPFPDAAEPKGLSDTWLTRQHDSQFWPSYWRHVNKQASQAAFRKRVRTLCRERQLAPEDAVKFLVTQARLDRERFEPTQDWEWRGKLHPATWLNGERWNDEAASVSPPTPRPTKGELAVRNIFEREQQRALEGRNG